jgi:hypothetical protein
MANRKREKAEINSWPEIISDMKINARFVSAEKS